MNADNTDTSATAAGNGATRRRGGFTLVEVVIAVAIAGILASASFGAYQNYVKRANRSAAQQFMIEMMNRQELYLRDARAYADAVGDAGLKMTVPDEVARHYAFNIRLTTGSPPGYVITATPVENQATDGVLSLSSSGVKSPPEKWER